MNSTRFVVTLTAVAMLSACKPAETETENALVKSSGDEHAAIDQVRQTWEAAWKAGDAAKLGSFYTADAADMSNHMPTNMGPEAIRAALAGQFGQMTPTAMTLVSEKTEVAGDMAYDRGTFDVTVTPKNGGAPISDKGRYLVVLRRQPDGSWKLSEAMGNSATPLPN